MAATLDLLEERGYNSLTLAAVADRAGTTKAAIYRRWGSKSELVSHAVFRTDGDDVVAETDDLSADLEQMIRWTVDKLARPAALAAIVGLLGESRDERRERASDAAIATRLVAERLARAQSAGELRADVDTRVLGALVDGPVLHMALSGAVDRIDDGWIADLVAVVFDGARPSRVRAVRRHRNPTRSDPRSATSEVPNR